MTRSTILSSLKTEPPDEFVENHLFDCIPALFEGDRNDYVSWKRELAKQLEVDAACVTLVGSAAIGISLNPSKNFREFNDDSDIDVAIVSHYHFTVAWRYLRMNGARRLRVDRKTRESWDAHVNRYIYWGTIATDKLLGVLPYGVQWMNAANHMATIAPTHGRDIKLRVYSDHDSLRGYHIHGVRSLRTPDPAHF